MILAKTFLKNLVFERLGTEFWPKTELLEIFGNWVFANTELSFLGWHKKSLFYGQKRCRDVCPNISGTEAATDKRLTVLERPGQAGSESVIRSRLSQTVRILRTKNRIASQPPWRLWAVAPSPGLKKTPNPEKGPASSKFFYPLNILLKFVMIWRNQSRSLENNCLSRDIQFAHRVFFQCPLSKQKCIQKNEARMAQIQIWWIPRRIPLTF